MNNQEASIALNMISGIGPINAKKLIAKYGNASSVLNSSVAELKKIKGISDKIANRIYQWEDNVNLKKELEIIQNSPYEVCILGEEKYPKQLSSLYDPPLVLYTYGNLRNLSHTFGIVGSRQASYYGIKMTKKISYQLAYQGFAIISGLARGIDTAAHQGALAAEGITIAVIGSGLNHLYPEENKALAKNIVENEGLLISEFPLNTPPDKRNFPRRNRLIAGWSEGLLVSECAKYSGAMITANYANEMGKNVYALPGPADQITFVGSHELIRDGAILVTKTEEILEDYEEIFKKDKKYLASINPIKSLGNNTDFQNSEEATILEILSSAPIHLDEIITITKLPTQAVISALMILEMKKQIQRLPGQYFSK